MGDYRMPATLIDTIKALERRVAALEKAGPVGIVDSTPTEDAAQGSLRKVRSGSFYVWVDDAWVVV